MKKILLLAVGLLLTVSLKAQFSGVGLRAGLNISSINDYIASESKLGFHAGGIINYDFNDYFYLQGGLMLSQKGCTTNSYIDVESIAYKIIDTFNAFYLAVPVLPSIRIPVMKDGFVILNIGPALNIGLWGTSATDTTYIPEAPIGYSNSRHTYNTFSDPDGFGRLDVSVMMGVGFQFKQFSFNFNYDYGFIMLNQKRVMTGTNSVYMFSLGYTFGLNKD